MRISPLSCLVFFFSVLNAADCMAERVSIPLDMEPDFIESLLREAVFTGPGTSVRINDDGSGCQFLELREPRIGTGGAGVRLRTEVSARAGRAVGDRCILLLDWAGEMEFTQQAVVGADGESVLLKTESWRVLAPDGETATVSTTIGRWLEQFMPLGLRETRVGFEQPLTELRALLALSLDRDRPASAHVAPDTLAIDDVVVNDDRVTVLLGLDAPAGLAPGTAAEPELSQAELALLEERLGSVDDFATYLVKYLAPTGAAAAGQAGSPAAVQAALFEALLETRLDLVASLSDPGAGGGDAARVLFVKTWNRLTPILHEMAEQQPDHDGALRYLTFIGAGDMLRALDALGPATGIEISRDGLRRLVRMLVPEGSDDPLRHRDDVDPELRRSLGFGEPLPVTDIGDETAWLDWLVSPAVAVGRLDPATVKKLNSWVPRTEDMDTYLPMVAEVLNEAVRAQLGKGQLDPRFHEVFRQLVLTAAWQESCWRQFAVKDDKRVPLKSGSGDIGLMQINERVWRGLYDLQGLRWDMLYNARAGADILEHYMIKYSIRHREHETTGSVDNLARSAYAAYNGGPRAYDRYRRRDASGHGKKVDTLFYEKFRVTKSGRELVVATCFK
jgi:hypothetical protein